MVREPAKVRRLIGLTGQYAAVDELLSGEENLYMLGRLLVLHGSTARGLEPASCWQVVRPLGRGEESTSSPTRAGCDAGWTWPRVSSGGRGS